MSMKPTDLQKLKAKKIAGGIGPAPDRFGKGVAHVVDKREQRKLDQEAGLVPFAVKLHGDLVKQLQTLAAEKKVTLGEITTEILTKGLPKKK